MPETERENHAAKDLHTFDAERIVSLMLEEEAKSIARLSELSAPVAELATFAAHALKNGGRIFYAGAGTSGRVATMDAVECVPTFGTDASTVQALMAGGSSALCTSIEGAEDDAKEGTRQVVEACINEIDLVIGISASGATPFVLAVLKEAAKRGAMTGFITSSTPGIKTDVVVKTPTGPEVLTGSTRLKAATAAKVVLNAISTTAMVLAGKTSGPLMVSMKPTNLKLRGRAVRMVCTLAGVNEQDAQSALAQSEWNINIAALVAAKKISCHQAEVRLVQSGSIEEALE